MLIDENRQRLHLHFCGGEVSSYRRPRSESALVLVAAKGQEKDKVPKMADDDLRNTSKTGGVSLLSEQQPSGYRRSNAFADRLTVSC